MDQPQTPVSVATPATSEPVNTPVMTEAQEPEEKPVRKQGPDQDIPNWKELMKASYDRMEGAALTRKQQVEFDQLMDSDPRRALAKYPRAVEALRQQTIEQLAYEDYLEKLSPEQRRMEERERDLQKREEEYKRQETEAEAAYHSEQEAQFKERAAAKYVSVLKRYDIPITPETVAKMAEAELVNLEMQAHLPENRQRELSPEELAEYVNKFYSDHAGKYVRSLKGPQLLKYLGSDVVNEVKRTILQQYSAKREQPVSASPTSSQQLAPKSHPGLSYEEELKQRKAAFRRQMGGG